LHKKSAGVRDKCDGDEEAEHGDHPAIAKLSAEVGHGVVERDVVGVDGPIQVVAVLSRQVMEENRSNIVGTFR